MFLYVFLNVCVKVNSLQCLLSLVLLCAFALCVFMFLYAFLNVFVKVNSLQFFLFISFVVCVCAIFVMLHGY